MKRLQLVAQIFANALARKRADQELREAAEINRATFEQAAVGIAHVGIDGRWLRVNDKLCDIVGYPREELLQLTFQDITHPDDLETDLEYVRQVLSGKIKTYSMEKRYFRKDRSVVWVNLTVSLVRGADGRTPAFHLRRGRHHRAQTCRGGVSRQRGPPRGGNRSGRPRVLRSEL